jgi:aryl-alcohol dehydrogenase-like predicted oxidoreductase
MKNFKNDTWILPSAGLGSMELSINANRPSADEAFTLLDSLITDYGLTYIDTADCYCHGEEEFGYGERLMSKFVQRKEVLIASKIGMKREGTAWKACGDPKYLRSACELSLKNLGVDSIELCQFHTIDRSVPIEDSIGELSRLQTEGKVKSIGICNFYTLEEIEKATSVANIVSLQNALSIFIYESELFDPMLRFCEEQGITFVAFANFGGHRYPNLLASDERIVKIADDANLSVHQLALLFLKSLSPAIISIPGSINKSHIIENLSVNGMTLPEPARNQITKLLKDGALYSAKKPASVEEKEKKEKSVS